MTFTAPPMERQALSWDSQRSLLWGSYMRTGGVPAMPAQHVLVLENLESSRPRAALLAPKQGSPRTALQTLRCYLPYLLHTSVSLHPVNKGCWCIFTLHSPSHSRLKFSTHHGPEIVAMTSLPGNQSIHQHCQFTHQKTSVHFPNSTCPVLSACGTQRSH